jgi:hypothetical protein
MKKVATFARLKWTFAAALLFAWLAADRGFLSAQSESSQPTQDPPKTVEPPLRAPASPTKPADAPVAAEQPAAKPEDPAARKTLEAARDRLINKYRSLKADLTETVVIGDRKFKTTGTYLQGSTLKLRLELTVRLGDAEASVLEVCDGQVLWTRHRINKESRITRRDVTEILRAADANPNIERGRLIAELGLGGLPALLAAIQKSITFESSKNEEIDGKTFTVIEGTWNQDYLVRLRQANGKQEELPPYVPDRVRIYFQQDNLFPRRILYLKRNTVAKSYRPMVKLDFERVVPDAPVKDEDFYYVPPEDVLTEDITNSYIRQLTAAGRPPAAKADDGQKNQGQ